LKQNESRGATAEFFSEQNFFLILVLAFAIRCINYVGPVRGDDFRYLALAFDSQFGQINMEVWSAADRVAFYMPISWMYRLFGANEWTSVAFPLLASLLTVYLIYLSFCMLSKVFYLKITFPSYIYLIKHLKRQAVIQSENGLNLRSFR